VVDLRDAFRPFVDEAAAAPRRSVAEIASRADAARRRRGRRRTAALAAGAGLTALVAVLALVGPLRGHDPSSRVSVADTPAASTTPGQPDEPSTTAPTRPSSTTAPSSTASTPTTAADGPATTTAAPPSTVVTDEAPLVALTDGVTTSATTTSSWEDGYCVQIRVENTTGAAVEWQVQYRSRGHIATLWNAVADRRDGDVTFAGDEFNHRLEPAASTSFGACVDT
jgi:hypothetical protein